jgi:hypothetical protein
MFFYVFYVPIIVHFGEGFIDLLQPEPNDPADAALSFVMFIVYFFAAFTYQLAKVDYKWSEKNKMSMSRFTDSGLKLIIVAILSLLTIQFDYRMHPVVYLS